MLKLFVLILMIVFLSSCGVYTASSSTDTVSTDAGNGTGTGSDTDQDVDLDLIDPNPIETDDNVTDPIDPTQPEDPDSIYDSVGAIKDSNACTATTYSTASDASYNGTDPAENGSDVFSVADEGLGIRSEHLEGSSANLLKTWVTLYYKSFPDLNDLGNQGYTSYVMDGFFFLTYDIAWSDSSIAGTDRTMYVKTNQGVKPVCHRLVLNNIDGTLIDVQKVYR